MLAVIIAGLDLARHFHPAEVQASRPEPLNVALLDDVRLHFVREAAEDRGDRIVIGVVGRDFQASQEHARWQAIEDLLARVLEVDLVIADLLTPKRQPAQRVLRASQRLSFEVEHVLLLLLVRPRDRWEYLWPVEVLGGCGPCRLYTRRLRCLGPFLTSSSGVRGGGLHLCGRQLRCQLLKLRLTGG